MNKFIERILKVPIGTKIAAIAAVVILLTAANYWLLISEAQKSIQRDEAAYKKHETELVDKKVIADNLNQYRRDKEVLERRLAEALTELPVAAEIDELLRQFNDVGKKSGLEIKSIEPGKEQPQSFYAAIPIKMTVVGSYHEIAVFFESISKLRRIVNVNNLSLKYTERKNEKVLLTASYLATTFRFVERGSQVEDPKKARGRAAPKKGAKR